MPAICRPPSTPPGGLSRPASRARRRISSIAVGYAQEVPRPISTRLTSRVSRSWANPPTSPPTADEDDPGEEDPARPEHLGGLARRGLRDRARQVQRGDQRRGLPDRHPEPVGDRQQRRRDQRAVDGVEGRADEQRGGELPRERAARPGRGVAGRARRTCLWWRADNRGSSCLSGRRSQQIGEALDQGRRGGEDLDLLVGE